MHEGLTPQLLRASLAVLVVCYLLARRELSRRSSLGLALLRVGIPLVFFAWLFDGRWTQYDDMKYVNLGELLLNHGHGPLSVFGTSSEFDYLISVAGSEHYLYIWWNLLAQWLFGAGYWAPVLLNVAATFVSALVVAKLLRHCGFSDGYVRGFVVFFLLHWDVLVWSSFLNLKDTLVMTLTITALYLLVRLSEGVRLWLLLAIAGVMTLFLALRFYVPPVLLASYGAWLLLQWRSPRKYPLLLITGGVFLFLMRAMMKQYAYGLQYVEGDSLLYGVARFVLTPQPWRIEENYSFLLLPSLLHWALVLVTPLAAWHLWRQSPKLRLVLIYTAAMIVLYASVPASQGPRHRLQISFVFALLQYHFLYSLVASLRRERVESTSLPGRPLEA